MFSHLQVQKQLSKLIIAVMLFTEMLMPLSYRGSVVYGAPTLSISKALVAGTVNPIDTGVAFDYEITW
jgi:hypothetical protein